MTHCDLRDRAWDPCSEHCETCGRYYKEWPKKDCTGKLGSEASDMTEAAFLAQYKHEEYPKPSVTVDLVIFTVCNTRLHVLLIKRKGHPYKGSWALPGGFVDVGDAYQNQGEDIEAAAHRELAEETGLPEGSCFLEQLCTFGKPGRDPRTRVITVAHYALVPGNLMPLVKPGDDAAEAQWIGMDVVFNLPLAFDHAHVLEVALARIRGKIDYAPIAFGLVPKAFTTAELRAVYEAVKGDKYDPSNFHRRFRRMVQDGVIREVPGKRTTATRPAKVYEFVK